MPKLSDSALFNFLLAPDEKAKLLAIAKHKGNMSAAVCLRWLISEKYDEIRDALPQTKSREPEHGLTYDSSPDFSQYPRTDA